MTTEQINYMKTTKFKQIVKVQSHKSAFEYLLDKQKKGKKGKLISYKQIEMADYLLPECTISVKNKTDLFAFRCEMNQIPNNFGKEELCEQSCQELMNNEHLLNCVHLNEGKHNQLQLEQLRNGDISDKIDVLKKLQDNSSRRISYINARTQEEQT